MVQCDTAGVRVRSVQQWNGNRSMNSGTELSLSRESSYSSMSTPSMISVSSGSMQKITNSASQQAASEALVIELVFVFGEAE